jgi:hypothetical protein
MSPGLPPENGGLHPGAVVERVFRTFIAGART